MSISSNETIAQRFTVTHSKQYEDVVFCSITDEQTQSKGYSISPTPSAQLRKGAEEHFRQIHALQNPVWQGKHNQTMIAVYKNHLAPIDTLPKLSIEDAEQLLHNLLVQLQSTSQLFPHGIRKTDMAVNEDGHIVLLASGVIPKENHVRPEIVTSQGTPTQKSLYSIAIHVLSTVTTLPTIDGRLPAC